MRSSPRSRVAGLDDQEIEQAALRYLARRDRTEAQVTGLLRRRGVSAARIAAQLQRLRRLGYLNDKVYARRWAESRIARKPMGRLRLEAELLAQGLDRPLVLNTLDAVYGGRSERDLARDLLRARAAQALSQARQVRLLRSHGFSEETIELVVGS